MNHNAHIPLARREMTPAILAGAPIYDTDDTKIATIADVHGFGAADGVVINVGGFFGIGAKPVLIGVDHLNLVRDEVGNVLGVTSWTKEKLKILPEHRT